MLDPALPPFPELPPPLTLPSSPSCQPLLAPGPQANSTVQKKVETTSPIDTRMIFYPLDQV
jgi:hypothetical protein